MERNQAVERLVAALTPVVSAELDRTLEEGRQKLESDYKTRLQDASLEAQTQARQSLEGEIQRAAQQAADAARRELMVSLERQIRKQIEDARIEARERARADFEAISRLQSANAEPVELVPGALDSGDRERLDAQIAEWRLLAGAEIRLVEADSQMEMLVRFMKLASGFAESIAIYVARPAGLTLWKSRGPKTFPQTITAETAGADIYFRSVDARGKPVAGIAAAPASRRDALDFLTGCLERAIKLLGLKLQNPVTPASSKPPEAETAHAEARETARSLISEIASSREIDVIHGRVNSDIYHRLQGDIETARRNYLDRVPCTIAASRDYFDEELVRSLAENHPSLMGAGFPGRQD